MRAAVVAAVISSLLVGCTNPIESIEKLKSQSELQAAEAESLRTEIEALKSRLTETEKAVFDSMLSDGSRWAFVVLGEGYGTAKTHLGTSMFVAWEDSQAQGDGTLVTLSIGNPYYATFNGFQIQVKSFKAPTEKGGLPVPAAETEKKQTSTLAPGRWNRVAVRIPGVKPDELSALSVKVVPDVISMAK